MKMKVSIVIPSWNGERLISECLQSLQRQSEKATIIVVDNGSTDNSVEIIRQSFPDVTLIELDHNYGFSGGVNAGLRLAMEKGCEYVAVLNNDAITEKDWLKQMIIAMESSPDTGIVTPKQLLADKIHIDAAGNDYSVWGLPFARGRGQMDEGQFNNSESVFAATGAATLFRTKMLQQIGLFDEKFFAYYEDVDLSFRARLAGWNIVYEPGAVIYHDAGSTSRRMGNFSRYHATKNFHLLFLKNMPGYLFWKYLPLAVLQSFRLALGSIFHGQYLTHLRGYFAAVLLLPYTLKERRRIQKSRKVPVAAIDKLLYHGRPPKIPIL